MRRDDVRVVPRSDGGYQVVRTSTGEVCYVPYDNGAVARGRVALELCDAFISEATAA